MAFEIYKVQEDLLTRVIRRTNPFDELRPSEIHQLVLASRRVQVKKGKILYKAGETASYVYFLIEGTVKITMPSFGTKEVIHNLINSPAIFGLWECAGSGVIKNNAVCLSSGGTCYKVPFNLIKRLMHENASFNLKLFSYLSEKIKKNETRVEQLMLKDARERIIHLIKDNAIRKGKRIGYEILLKHNFTQQDIADFTGTSRQTVTNILKELRENNDIHIERKSILIRDISNLK